MYNSIEFINISIFRTGIGYYYLTLFMHKVLNINFEVVTVIFSFVTNGLIYLYLKEKSENFKLSLIMYITLGIYILQFNIMRQMLSFAVILYAILLFDNKKKKTGIGILIFGILIHTTNAFFVIIYFLTKNIITKKIKISTVIIVGCILLLFFNPLYNLIVNKVEQLNIYSKTSEKYEAGIGTYLIVIFQISLMIIMEFFYKRVPKDKINVEYINIYYIGVITLILSINNVLFSRLAQQLLFYSAIIIPNMLEIVRIKLNTKLLINYICFLILMLYYIMYINSFGEVVPYTSIFHV